jgi:integrase
MKGVTKQKRRGKTRWVVDWTDRSGKRHQPQFRTKEAAEAEEERIRQSLRAQHGRTPELPEDILWSQLFDRVMKDRGDLKPRTVDCYKEIHERYLAPAFGVTPVKSLTRLRIREFLRIQLNTYARNTVRLMCATLHVVLAEATEDGLIPANPATGLARKLKLSTHTKARQEAVKVKAMTRTERDSFLATAERIEPWWAPAWTVQALTGVRPGELLALEERDINLAARTLRVERSLSVDGHDIGTPKGGFGRDIDLSNEAVRVLRAHLTHRREEKLQRKWRELPKALFCSTVGTYADPSGMREAFRRVCITGKLTEPHPSKQDKNGKPRLAARFTPHGLRHTYAALHLQHGTDVYYVSRQLGHADISLTVGTYGAWLQPARRAAVDALDRTTDAAPAEVEAQA